MARAWQGFGVWGPGLVAQVHNGHFQVAVSKGLNPCDRGSQRTEEPLPKSDLVREVGRVGYASEPDIGIALNSGHSVAAATGATTSPARAVSSTFIDASSKLGDTAPAPRFPTIISQCDVWNQPRAISPPPMRRQRQPARTFPKVRERCGTWHRGGPANSRLRRG